MKIQEITIKNLKYYQEFIPPELSFLFHIKDYAVLGLIDEEDGISVPAGIMVLSFRVPDAISMEWLYVAEEYRGQGYCSLFLDAVHDICLANDRNRIIGKVWGSSTYDGADFLLDLGFVPAFPDYSDTVYFLSDLNDIDELAMVGEQAHKAGFELEEIAKNSYIPRVYGTPDPASLKKSMAHELYVAASKEESANAAVYLRCAPWEDVAVINKFFSKSSATITSECYEAPVDISDYLERAYEREQEESQQLQKERDAIPTSFVMVGLEEY